MKSIKDIDLSPKPGKKYWVNCHREWREEFIYFLLIDRFHDSNKRHTIGFDTRHSGFGNSEQLSKPCGGTIRGILNHLDYIRNLGCTAIWLSPVFKNNPEAYHGYAIEDYLEIDERFGTKGDLEDLVERAHQYESWMKPVYGSTSNVEIKHSEDPANPVCYIHLYLRPMQLVILKNIKK